MGIVLGTCVINLLLFLGIPLLSRIGPPGGVQHYDTPVLISRAPPPPEPEPAVAEKPPEEKPPPHIKQTPEARLRKPKQPPRISRFMPQLEMRLSPGINSGVTVPVFEGGGGYEIVDVDVAPRLIRKVNPAYPYRARRRQLIGRVVVRFLVDSKGRVRELSIQDSTPSGVFDAAVLNAVSKWRFNPGMKGGRAVSTWMVLPLEFDLS